MKTGMAKVTSTSQDFLLLTRSLKALDALFAQGTDIHTHTKAIGKTFNEVFYRLDKQHRTSTIEDYNRVEAEILKCSSNHPNVIKVLNSIRTRGHLLESETGIYARDLLVRTWNLAKNEDNYSNAKELVIDNLKHNIETGGGCIAGICARLVMPYAHFIKHLLTFIPTPPIQQDLSDVDMAKAIAASLAEKAPIPTSLLTDEDADLAAAIALSEQLSRSRIAPQVVSRPTVASPPSSSSWEDDAILAQVIAESMKLDRKQKSKP